MHTSSARQLWVHSRNGKLFPFYVRWRRAGLNATFNKQDLVMANFCHDDDIHADKPQYLNFEPVSIQIAQHFFFVRHYFFSALVLCFSSTILSPDPFAMHNTNQSEKYTAQNVRFPVLLVRIERERERETEQVWYFLFSSSLTLSHIFEFGLLN